MTARAALLDFLRVPAAPSAPAGDEDVRVFRAAPNYFWYKLLRWAIGQAGTVVGLIFGLIMLGQAHEFVPATIGPGALTITEATVLRLLLAVEVVAIGLVIIRAAVSLVLLRLDFEQRWYIVSDRSLRIREGLVRLKEKTMTFANIQQVSIRQGPVQRLLGIADLEVRTAGGGGSKSDEHGMPRDDLHVGYFRGVAHARQIRDAIRDRLRRHRDAGLGDPDDLAHDAMDARESAATASLAASGPGRILADAATALSAEARALRAVLEA